MDRPRLEEDGGRPLLVFLVDRGGLAADGRVAIGLSGDTSSYEEEMVGANANSVGLGVKICCSSRFTRGGVCITLKLTYPELTTLPLEAAASLLTALPLLVGVFIRNSLVISAVSPQNSELLDRLGEEA